MNILHAFISAGITLVAFVFVVGWWSLIDRLGNRHQLSYPMQFPLALGFPMAIIVFVASL